MKLTNFFLLISIIPFYLFSNANDDYFVNLKPSPLLTKFFLKLEHILSKSNKSSITIVHFGDSHVQGDLFSGEVRKLVQFEFGHAGQGIIFPYSLSKSYGPKGVIASTKGVWTGTNILKNQEKDNLGITGYTLRTMDANSQLNIEITDKFSGKLSNRISIWTSSDLSSFDYKINDEFNLIDEKNTTPNLKCRTYESNSDIKDFNLSLIQKNDSNQTFYFHGFEFVSAAESGINYHRYGVVGAQFTHLINNAELLLVQLSELKPDLIIFSFGTNEAYNSYFDTSVYYKSINNFIEAIRKNSPEVAILITTAPDTRSQGRTPPNQIRVNQQLMRIAKDLDLSMYDLNEAMGGWGSLYRWYENNLTLKDKLHFNSNGYSLQGKMLTHAIFKEFNQFSDIKIQIDELENQIKNSLNPLFYYHNELNDNNLDQLFSKPAQTKEINKTESKNLTHSVKQGDTIWGIARKHNTTVQKILKENKLQETSIIFPGQKIIIPIN